MHLDTQKIGRKIQGPVIGLILALAVPAIARSRTTDSTALAQQSTYAPGTVVGQATIAIHHSLGSQGDLWVTQEETLLLPPPKIAGKAAPTVPQVRRIVRKYWLYPPNSDGPQLIFGGDSEPLFDFSTGFAADGPIGSPTVVDILLDARLTTDGAIVNVEHLQDGSYQAGLWVNEKLGGWKFLGSDSEVLIQGENSLPLRTAIITGSLDKKDLTITLKGTKDTRRFRFRSDAGRWYELTSPATRPSSHPWSK